MCENFVHPFLVWPTGKQWTTDSVCIFVIYLIWSMFLANVLVQYDIYAIPKYILEDDLIEYIESTTWGCNLIEFGDRVHVFLRNNVSVHFKMLSSYLWLFLRTCANFQTNLGWFQRVIGGSAWRSKSDSILQMAAGSRMRPWRHHRRSENQLQISFLATMPWNKIIENL